MASDDFKIKKTDVDIVAMMRRNPQHKRCDLCIKRSKKNPLFVGLYCKQHDHWLSWINNDQREFLKNLDSSIVDLS
jgi:hypothetical protein